MAFLSLYRKYRPQNFEDLVGQKHVIKTLKNALENNRIAHAYLFAGPRGTGKTSTAKIFAQALNCVEGPTAEPCGICDNCQMIQSGQSIDVIELDAASNRGIEEIRDLLEKVKFYPGEGRYKVYIIDEVHMLTKGAFNALLKTLEEPPENVVFILATTEPHKVLDTILSRCQRFDFSLLSSLDIKKRLEYICKEEKVEYDEQSLSLIAAACNGGLRDAISLLDQAISYTNGNLQAAEIQEMLGKVDAAILQEFMAGILDKNSSAVLKMLNEIISSGKGISIFVRDLIDFLRQVMLFKECGGDSGIFNFTEDTLADIEKTAGRINIEGLIRFLEILTDVEKEMAFTERPRISVELAVIKMISSDQENPYNILKERIDELEKRINKFIEKGFPKKAEENSKENVEMASGDSGEKEENRKEEKGFSIDDVKKVWPEILKKIRENSVSIQALLVEGKPYRVEGNNVYILFPSDKSFHKKGAEQHSAIIQKVMSKALSFSCQPVFVCEGEEDNKKKEAELNKDADNEKETESDEKGSDVVVSRLVKAFNGKIIKVNYDALE